MDTNDNARGFFTKKEAFLSMYEKANELDFSNPEDLKKYLRFAKRVAELTDESEAYENMYTPEEFYNETISEENTVTEAKSERDVLIACSGENFDGTPKAVCSVKLADINVETGNENVIDEIIVDSAIVNVFRSAVSTMVDLTFLNPQDYEFVDLVTRMQSFCKADMEPADPQTIRTIVVTIVPNEFEECYCAGLNAAWVIQPSKVGALNDTVRFIIDSEYFNVYTVDFDTLEEMVETAEYQGWE